MTPPTDQPRPHRRKRIDEILLDTITSQAEAIEIENRIASDQARLAELDEILNELTDLTLDLDIDPAAYTQTVLDERAAERVKDTTTRNAARGRAAQRAQDRKAARDS